MVDFPPMGRDFFEPSPEQQNVLLIDSATLREAERLIETCEHCNPEGAEIPFDNILDRLTGSDPGGNGLRIGGGDEVSELPRSNLGKNIGRTGVKVESALSPHPTLGATSTLRLENPTHACTKTVPKPSALTCLELALSEKQIP